MEIFALAVLFATVVVVFNKKEERRRIALLARHLGQYQIEKLMENLAEGYLRAIASDEPVRRDQIWLQMNPVEGKIADQFGRFATGFAREAEPDTRVSTLPLPLPHADKVFPAATFDARKALSIHAQGIARVTANGEGLSPKARAYTLSAELYLMQHTCHWYCRSRGVASARLLVRHKTSYEQVLASVSPATRQAYEALLA